MFCLLLLRAEIKPENWGGLVENAAKTPFFVMAYTGGCLHCRRAVPKFDEFAESMENNTDVMIGAVNCSNHMEFCKSELTGLIGGFPSFIIGTKFGNERVEGIANSLFFNSAVGKILKLMNGTLIESGGVNAEIEYPRIVFDVDEEGLEIAERAVMKFHYFNNMTFARKAVFSGKRTAIIEVDSDFSVEMADEFTYERIIKFMEANCHEVLGRSWTYTNVIRTGKSMVACFVEREEDAKAYRALAERYWGEFVWGVILENPSLMAMFSVTKEDLPAVGIFNVTSKQFVKIVKADVAEIVLKLEKFIVQDESLVFEAMEMRPPGVIRVIGWIKTGMLILTITLVSVAVAAGAVFFVQNKKAARKED